MIDRFKCLSIYLRDADKLAADIKFLQSEHEEHMQNATKEYEARENDLQEQLQAAYDKVYIS